MKRKALVVFLAVVLALSPVIFSACPAPEEEDRFGAEPIKIGAPDALTGPYAVDGILMYNGTIMAAEEINAAGGLLGRQLKVIPFDIEDMMAEKLIAAAEKLIGRDKVDVVITSCNAAGADVEAFGKYDVPYLHFNASRLCIEMFRDDPNKWNVFMLGDVEAPYGGLDFEVTERLPYQFPNKKIALIAADYEWDRLYVQGFKERAMEKGWEIVMDEVVPYGTSEWGPILAKIRPFDPAIIHFSAYSPPDLVTFFRQFSEDPTNSILCFAYGVSIPEFTEILGEEGDGICGTSAAGFLPDEKGKAWAERYRDRFNEEAPKNASAATTYDAVMAWAAAVTRVGDVTDYQAICKALDDYPHEGVNGIYAWDEDHKIPTSPSYPQHYFQVQNGKIITLYIDITPVPGTAFETPPWLK